MLEFCVPVHESDTGRRASDRGDGFFRFLVTQRPVLVSGNQRLSIPQHVCLSLAEAFQRQARGIMTGCGSGVERSFRYAISLSDFSDSALVACASSDRTDRAYGLFAAIVAPDNIPFRTACIRRTLWMVKRCGMALLFPDTPVTGVWNSKSRLIFRTVLEQIKPVFIVTAHQPEKSDFYRVLPCSLFGVVDGYWVVPHPIYKDGSLDDEW